QTSPRDYDSLNQLSTLRQRTRRIGKTQKLKLNKECRAIPQGFASKMDTAKYIQRLQNDSDWTKWFNSLRMVATVYDVWDYIDPDQAVANTKPQPNYPDDVSLANFSNLLNLEKAKFELREREYRRVQQSLNDVLKWIISTVDAQHMNQVSRHSSLRDMVKSLKENLAPSSQARQDLVKRRYILHLESIKRQSIIDWLNTYLDIMEEARVLDIISMSDPREQDGEDSDGSLSSSYFNEEPRIPAASLFSGSPLKNSRPPAMASQPPAGSGPMPASSAGPDRGSGAPPEPSPTSRAKRRRDTEAQPARPSLVGSQPDASTTTPLTAKGPSTVNGTAAGAVLTALSEEAKLYEARKDVFMAIAQSVDNVVSCFEGPRKQIAKEATTYVVQALKRIMGNGTAAPTPSRNWAKVVA
ncbi:hypothetical protein CCHR01_17633, partial [Colletotrichum chrysophilum]